MELTYPRGINVEEIFKKEVTLKEEIAQHEDENKELLLEYKKWEKLFKK